MKKEFTKNLLKWNEESNKRIMPWKGEKDPYKIWLSEVILQQTRVEQGLMYYKNFITRFPVIEVLAAAPDEEVFKLWEGLGYYSRCKNLLATARLITKEYEGIFPRRFEEILKLKGVGTYTASAIASFAYNLPYAVIDGNVLRVLSRYFGKAIAIDSTKGKQYFNRLAQQLLHTTQPATYNQAIMDFGATVCKPQLPLCEACVMQTHCIAYKKNWVNKLPLKEKKLLKRNRWFYYFIFDYQDEVLVNQRAGKDIWQNLFEFYLYEAEAAEEWTPKRVEEWLNHQLGIIFFDLKNISPVYAQKLTHQNLQGRFITVTLPEIPSSLAYLQRVKKEQLPTLAFPKFITHHLKSLILCY